jgi:DNA-binding XRE family transcriptional regulator
MTRSTHSLSASSQATTSFERVHQGPWVDAVAEQTVCEIVRIDQYRTRAPAPEGFVTVADLVKRSESMPDRQAALVAARSKLAKLSGKPGGAPTLRSFRLSKGLSQQQFADLVGTSQPYVARLEANPAAAGLDFMRKFCKAFALDMNTANQILQ